MHATPKGLNMHYPGCQSGDPDEINSFNFTSTNSSANSPISFKLKPGMKFENLTLDFIRQQVERGDLRVIDHIYETYRPEFLSWAHHRYTTINHDDLLDTWQDTIVMFYEQVRDGKLKELTCELKTFLFMIGHRRIMNFFRKAGRIDYVEEVDVKNNMAESINIPEYELNYEDGNTFLQSAIDELPEQTRQILSLRYVQGKTIEEIMQIMNYSSANVVSATLSRALKKLKERILEKTEGTPPWKS